MLHQETERNALCYFQRSLHFVHSVEAPYAFSIGNRNGHAAFAPGRKVAFRGRMQGMQLQMIFGKRVGEFTHCLWLSIIEMPRRAKDLNAGDSSLRNLRQQRSSQRLVDVAVSRKYALHSAPVRFVV